MVRELEDGKNVEQHNMNVAHHHHDNRHINSSHNTSRNRSESFNSSTSSTGDLSRKNCNGTSTNHASSSATSSDRASMAIVRTSSSVISKSPIVSFVGTVPRKKKPKTNLVLGGGGAFSDGDRQVRHQNHCHFVVGQSGSNRTQASSSAPLLSATNKTASLTSSYGDGFQQPSERQSFDESNTVRKNGFHFGAPPLTGAGTGTDTGDINRHFSSKTSSSTNKEARIKQQKNINSQKTLDGVSDDAKHADGNGASKQLNYQTLTTTTTMNDLNPTNDVLGGSTSSSNKKRKRLQKRYEGDEQERAPQCYGLEGVLKKQQKPKLPKLPNEHRNNNNKKKEHSQVMFESQDFTSSKTHQYPDGHPNRSINKESTSSNGQPHEQNNLNSIAAKKDSLQLSSYADLFSDHLSTDGQSNHNHPSHDNDPLSIPGAKGANGTLTNDVEETSSVIDDIGFDDSSSSDDDNDNETNNENNKETTTSLTHFVEEKAWRLHNHVNRETQELDPLPPALPVPVPPNDKWTFREVERVMFGDFTDSKAMNEEDKMFLLQCMERNDITVITEGWASGLNPQLWNLSYIKNSVGDEYYHRFRVFQRRLKHLSFYGATKSKSTALSTSATTTSSSSSSTNAETHPQPDTGNSNLGNSTSNFIDTGTNGITNAATETTTTPFCQVNHKEENYSVALCLKDYVRYLDQRRSVLETIVQRRMAAGLDPQNPTSYEDDQKYRIADEETFTYRTPKGLTESINCIDTVLYMIDYDLVKLLPKLYQDFLTTFQGVDLLPGGKHCMMHEVTSAGRPFMGPNLYVTPPSAFTHFHQDGHGTVDSGHLVLSGYNEVVMLRRLPEQHKRHAIYLLSGKQQSPYDVLYGLPHADEKRNELPQWPSMKDIEECQRMNYYPSVFILKPGQWVHINKGRLHAFRKLSPTKLAPSELLPDPRHHSVDSRQLSQRDCHELLRNDISLAQEQLCISVAWDWTYRGISSEGTNREVVSMLECASLNRDHATQSLAIPETCVLQTAHQYVALLQKEEADATAKNNEQENDEQMADQRQPPTNSFLTSSFLPSRTSLASPPPPSTTTNDNKNHHLTETTTLHPSPCHHSEPLNVLKGLLPSLLHIIRRHKAAENMAHWAALPKKKKLRYARRSRKLDDDLIERNNDIASDTPDSARETRLTIADVGNSTTTPTTIMMVTTDNSKNEDDEKDYDPRSTVLIADRPDTWENPQLFTVDPHGNDFFCKLCSEELSNVYLHCNGCELLLNKDFNICVSCHKERRYKQLIQMHPLNAKRHSTINHTGNFNYLRQSRCPCKNGPVCKACGYCCGCSCTCHESFTLRQRFMTIEREYQLLKDVQNLVKNSKSSTTTTTSGKQQGIEKLPMRRETRKRLEHVRKIPLTRPLPPPTPPPSPPPPELLPTGQVDPLSLMPNASNNNLPINDHLCDPTILHDGDEASRATESSSHQRYIKKTARKSVGARSKGLSSLSGFHNNGVGRGALDQENAEAAMMFGNGGVVDGFVNETFSEEGYKAQPTTSRQKAMANNKGKEAAFSSASFLSLPNSGSSKTASKTRKRTASWQWTRTEEQDLIDAYNQVGKGEWTTISMVVFDEMRSNEECRQRLNKFKAEGVVKGTPAHEWDDEEISRLQSAYEAYRDDWTKVSAVVGTNRSELHCCLKYSQVLNKIDKKRRKVFLSDIGAKRIHVPKSSSLLSIYAEEEGSVVSKSNAQNGPSVTSTATEGKGKATPTAASENGQVSTLTSAEETNEGTEKQKETCNTNSEDNCSLVSKEKKEAKQNKVESKIIDIEFAPVESRKSKNSSAVNTPHSSTERKRSLLSEEKEARHKTVEKKVIDMEFAPVEGETAKFDTVTKISKTIITKKGKSSSSPCVNESLDRPHWTEEEIQRLIDLYNQVGKSHWHIMAFYLKPLASSPQHEKTAKQCRDQVVSLLNGSGGSAIVDEMDLYTELPWTEEDERDLKEAYHTCGGSNKASSLLSPSSSSWPSWVIVASSKLQRTKLQCQFKMACLMKKNLLGVPCKLSPEISSTSNRKKHSNAAADDEEEDFEFSDEDSLVQAKEIQVDSEDITADSNSQSKGKRIIHSTGVSLSDCWVVPHSESVTDDAHLHQQNMKALFSSNPSGFDTNDIAPCRSDSSLCLVCPITDEMTSVESRSSILGRALDRAPAVESPIHTSKDGDDRLWNGAPSICKQTAIDSTVQDKKIRDASSTTVELGTASQQNDQEVVAKSSTTAFQVVHMAAESSFEGNLCRAPVSKQILSEKPSDEERQGSALPGLHHKLPPDDGQRTPRASFESNDHSVPSDHDRLRREKLKSLYQQKEKERAQKKLLHPQEEEQKQQRQQTSLHPDLDQGYHDDNETSKSREKKLMHALDQLSRFRDQVLTTPSCNTKEHASLNMIQVAPPSNKENSIEIPQEKISQQSKHATVHRLQQEEGLRDGFIPLSKQRATEKPCQETDLHNNAASAKSQTVVEEVPNDTTALRLNEKVVETFRQNDDSRTDAASDNMDSDKELPTQQKRLYDSMASSYKHTPIDIVLQGEIFVDSNGQCLERTALEIFQQDGSEDGAAPDRNPTLEETPQQQVLDENAAPGFKGVAAQTCREEECLRDKAAIHGKHTTEKSAQLEGSRESSATDNVQLAIEGLEQEKGKRDKGTKGQNRPVGGDGAATRSQHATAHGHNQNGNTDVQKSAILCDIQNEMMTSRQSDGLTKIAASPFKHTIVDRVQESEYLNDSVTADQMQLAVERSKKDLSDRSVLGSKYVVGKSSQQDEDIQESAASGRATNVGETSQKEAERFYQDEKLSYESVSVCEQNKLQRPSREDNLRTSIGLEREHCTAEILKDNQDAGAKVIRANKQTAIETSKHKDNLDDNSTSGKHSVRAISLFKRKSPEISVSVCMQTLEESSQQENQITSVCEEEETMTPSKQSISLIPPFYEEKNDARDFIDSSENGAEVQVLSTLLLASSDDELSQKSECSDEGSEKSDSALSTKYRKEQTYDGTGTNPKDQRKIAAVDEKPKLASGGNTFSKIPSGEARDLGWLRGMTGPLTFSALSSPVKPTNTASFFSSVLDGALCASSPKRCEGRLSKVSKTVISSTLNKVVDSVEFSMEAAGNHLNKSWLDEFEKPTSLASSPSASSEKPINKAPSFSFISDVAKCKGLPKRCDSGETVNHNNAISTTLTLVDSVEFSKEATEDRLNKRWFANPPSGQAHRGTPLKQGEKRRSQSNSDSSSKKLQSTGCKKKRFPTRAGEVQPTTEFSFGYGRRSTSSDSAKGYAVSGNVKGNFHVCSSSQPKSSETNKQKMDGSIKKRGRPPGKRNSPPNTAKKAQRP